MKTYTLQDHLKDSLKDPAFKKAWEESEAEYQVSRALIAARIKRKISQQELAKEANTTQAVISRLENMTANPLKNKNSRIRKLINASLNEAMNECKKVDGKPNKSDILDYMVGCMKISAETSSNNNDNNDYLANGDRTIESILNSLSEIY